MRILIRYDVVGWAFWRRAVAYQKYAPGDIHVDIMGDDEHYGLQEENPQRLQGYDVVWLLSMFQGGRGYGNAVVVRNLSSHTWKYYSQVDDLRTAGVNTSRNRDVFERELDRCTKYSVQNSELLRLVASYGADGFMAPYLIDTDLFRPSERRRKDGEPMTVGFCGQQTAAFKGGWLLEKLMQRFSCNELRFNINDTDFRGRLSGQRLRDWYNRQDVFLCLSSDEGGPQPPLEAAACSCLLAGTIVGQLRDWGDYVSSSTTIGTYRNLDEAEQVVDFLERLLRGYQHPEWLSYLRKDSEFLYESVLGNYSARYRVQDHLRALCETALS